MYLGTESCFFYGFLEIRQINNQKPYYIHKLEILDSFQWGGGGGGAIMLPIVFLSNSGTTSAKTIKLSDF